MLIDIIISFITVFPASIIMNNFGINKIPTFNIFEGSFFASGFGWFLLVVFFIPIYEEISSRLFLVLSKRNIIISLTFNLFLLYIFIINSSNLFYWVMIVQCLILLMIAILLFTKNLYSTVRIERYLLSHYTYVFYFSVVLFSIYHALGYNYKGFVGGLLVIMLILPKSISGCILGFVRIRMGLVWGFALHVMMNAVFFWISFL